MGRAQDIKTRRKDLRKAVGVDVAVNMLEMHRFFRRGFFGRLKWLLLGR